MRSLFPLAPHERQARIAKFLARGLKSLEKHCSGCQLEVQGDNGEAWTIVVRVPAKSVAELSKLPNVGSVWVRKIQGLRRRRQSTAQLEWFAVWGRVAIQVEGQVSGYQTVEDRVLLVKASSERDAKRRLVKEWKSYAEPYLNSEGYMVRWLLEEVLDVYALMDEEIDENGTEVYSRLRNRRMRPEYQWHPRGDKADV